MRLWNCSAMGAIISFTVGNLKVETCRCRSPSVELIRDLFWNRVTVVEYAVQVYP